ncbi:conjugal transfer protein [Mycobacterium tuberculosis]|nr:conjugal transfer protein [Mycobacterium tuberculosis]
MTGSLIERVRERLASESGPLRPSVVAAAIRAESGGMLGDTEVLANLRVLQTELTGAGILEPLLSADGTTDVLVTAPDSVWVDDGNGLRRSQIRFADESAVRRLAQRLALAAGRRLDDAQPWVDGQLTGIGVGGFAVRLHAVLPPVATQGTCLSLRVLRPATQDLAALAAAGAIDPAAAALVADIVTARLAFLVCGGTGAGKTTLLAAMLGAVSPDERIVCVEDAAELAPRHPHLVKLVARRANVEGIGEVTVRQLVRQALGCGPTASWSVRLGEPRWWICWRRSIPVTRAARAPYTPTTRVRSLHAWKRWGRSAALTALLCTASSPRQSKSCCTSRAIGQAVAGSPRSPCCAKLKGGSRR